MLAVTVFEICGIARRKVSVIVISIEGHLLDFQRPMHAKRLLSYDLPASDEPLPGNVMESILMKRTKKMVRRCICQ